jgi:polysaccharide biosynthesis transport protein
MVTPILRTTDRHDDPFRQYRDESTEQPVELRRYLAALGRNKLLILLIVVPLTGIVLALSLVLPKTYSASASILMQSTPFELADVETVRRELATTEALLTTRGVLEEAAQGLPGESGETLEDKVSASVDRDANLIDVQATDSDPEGAADIANAVARAFLERQRDLEQQQLARAQANLQQALTQAEASGSAEQVAALRERLSELTVIQASAGSQFELAQPARPPSEASSPLPVRNTLVALFASIFIAVLVALGREQLVPRVGGARELSALTGLPVLIGIPDSRRRFGRRRRRLSRAEAEAYQALQASLSMRLDSGRQRLVLVTSALDGEGKTEVTANLGRAFANAGEYTLLVSADMRRPRLHEHFGMDLSPGFAEVLAAGRRGPDPEAETAATVASRSPAQGRGPGALHVVASGAIPPNPAQLLSSDAVGAFFDEVQRLDYTNVLVDSPPLLGLVDGQILAQHVEHVLVVCRPDRLTRENVFDLRELLASLGVTPLGLVVVGEAGTSPYYLGAGVVPQRV